MGEKEFTKIALRVSIVSIVCNAMLSLFKFFAGIVAHSGAMVSDGVHSASDVISSFIVIIGVKISAKESDQDHPYGHERFECVAAVVLAVILLMSGLFIGYGAAEKIISRNAGHIRVPGTLALIAAAVSILTKETMYWYTRHYAKRLDSGALMADAWHHRSDALSSVGALIGIGGAKLGYPVFDPIASLVICLFIAKAAFGIFKDAIEKMVDRACSDETEAEMKACAAARDGVLGVDMLHTRIFGNKIYVDIEICADPKITLEKSHRIAEGVHDAIEEQFPKVKHIMVHVNPAPASDQAAPKEKRQEKNQPDPVD